MALPWGAIIGAISNVISEAIRAGKRGKRKRKKKDGQAKEVQRIQASDEDVASGEDDLQVPEGRPEDHP